MEKEFIFILIALSIKEHGNITLKVVLGLLSILMEK
jgi:hypothetical protein